MACSSVHLQDGSVSSKRISGRRRNDSHISLDTY
jgi:hypothetical protein